MTEHRWSWPGAICLDCGAEDPREIALADGDYGEICDENGEIIRFEFHFDPSLMECPMAKETEVDDN